MLAHAVNAAFAAGRYTDGNAVPSGDPLIGMNNLLRALPALILLPVLLCLPLASAEEGPEEDPLQLVGPPWPPYLHADDTSKGLAAEIVAAAFRAVDQPVEMTISPWRRVIWLARHGETDGLIGVWHADDRESFIQFSDPYHYSRIVVAYHRDHPVPGSQVEDLEGLQVSIREGAFYGRDFMGAEHFERTPASNDRSMLHMVRAQRVDAAVGDELILQQIIDSDERLRDVIRLERTPFLEIPIHFGAIQAVENAENRVEAFNRGLQKIRESGEYDRIQSRYNVEE